MKLNSIALEDIKHHLRIDFAEDDIYLLELLDVAKSYIKNYTGLEDDDIDSVDEFSSIALMIIADLYENKCITGTSSYKTGNSVNKIYESMLNLHCVNFI